MSLTPEMVFILHAKQPLTTDPAAVLPGPNCEVTVLSDPTGGPALREDVGESRARVHHAPVGQWRETIVGLAGSRRFDVLTNDEYALLTCRDLRAGLGLPPRHPHQLIQYLDKVEMKRRLTACGIGTARFVEVDRVAADTPAEALVARLGLPVVAKPRQEANSRGVQVLRSAEEVRRWQQRRHGQTGWHVEEYLEGIPYHVNGIVHAGTVTPVQVGRYLGPLLDLPLGRRLGGVILPERHELAPAAHALNAAVVAALGNDGSFVVHTEFVVRPDGRLTVQEVAARAPGAMVAEAARLHAGTNLEVCQLALQLGVPPRKVVHTGVQAGWVWVPVMPGETFVSTPVFDSDSLVHIRSAARRTSPSRTSGVLGASVLLWNSDDEQLARDLERALAWEWTR
jgi:hypothetical protein